jgi:hypothetical protein
MTLESISFRSDDLRLAYLEESLLASFLLQRLKWGVAPSRNIWPAEPSPAGLAVTKVVTLDEWLVNASFEVQQSAMFAQIVSLCDATRGGSFMHCSHRFASFPDEFVQPLAGRLGTTRSFTTQRIMGWSMSGTLLSLRSYDNFLSVTNAFLLSFVRHLVCNTSV